MHEKNVGLCSRCKSSVPAEFVIRDGQVWILKDCPSCGPNESLVSTDAAVWQAKGSLKPLLPGDHHKACSMRCDRCQIDHHPNMVFMDITNRCNMNCPICIATIRDMGFDFNPPLEYFDKVFGELSRMKPMPVVQLFGGEPTVREDLLDIIALGRRHGLRPHVFTNGVRLADEAYCRKLCKAGVPLRFAFDGHNPEFYERLRGNRTAGEKKLKALENLSKYSHRKHTMIACAAWGFNDQHIGQLLDFCHENRDLISDLGIVPLTENWEPGELQVERPTTMEDVEKMVAQSVEGGQVEFVPAGLSYLLRKPRDFFQRDTLSEILLLAGVHPNCESMTLLVSDGKTYRSINHYLKKPLSQAAVEFAELSRKMEPQLDQLNPYQFFQRLRGQFVVIRTCTGWVLRTVRVWRLKPLRTAARALLDHVVRRVVRLVGKRPRRARRLFRVVVLPIEEQHSIDAARLKNCRGAFVYEDVEDGRIKFFPACCWYPYRNPLLEKIARKYGTVHGGRTIPGTPGPLAPAPGMPIALPVIAQPAAERPSISKLEV